MYRKRGFTLIELLVVIAIIAILAAILFPVFTSVKEKGRQTACLSDMMQLAKGFRMYLDDKDGRFPSPSPLYDSGSYNSVNYTYDDVLKSGWLYYDSRVEFNLSDTIQKSGIFPYVKNAAVYQCPGDKAKRKGLNGISYSMNSQFWWIRESDVRRSAKTVMLIDEGKGAYSISKRRSQYLNDGCFGVSLADPESGDLPSDQHCGGGNFGWADGHCTWVPWKSFGNLNFDPRKAVDPIRKK
ncbi:MAG: prepilin-type N-terminal cleavage/methylation domain-containing protein [Armatimonadota bacterium]|nr:prepilin-type N-terminal cleavage/methylation domain-containing protein [bacterium]